MTSTVIYHDDKLKSAFGVHPELQKPALKEAYHLLETMKFTGNAKKFDKGGMTAINVVFSISDCLMQKFGVPHLKTSYLNQCYLERFFGELRGAKGNDNNPAPLHLLYRIQRKIICQILDDETFDLLANRDWFEDDNPPALPTNDFDACDDESLEPLFEEIENSVTESEGLVYIAGTIAKQAKSFGLDLGSTVDEIEDESSLNPRFLEFLKEGQVFNHFLCSKLSNALCASILSFFHHLSNFSILCSILSILSNFQLYVQLFNLVQLTNLCPVFSFVQ